MRVLTDRHHADLLYSLQLLFEDRLGGEVYVPVGRDWWDEGYWRFGEALGDDRLARQYLDPNYPWEGDPLHLMSDGDWFTHDPAHPTRMIYGVELATARCMRWDAVMPTVQENQAGYARFADERNARYLYHVGNTGQQVDWNLNPTVLATSELEVPEGRRGLTGLHQELADAFRWSDPDYANRWCVRNFVNAFNRLPGYDAFLRVERALGRHGWTFTSHGHEGRDGDINPVGAVGALMASAGWGWHDKPVGDGFGHVMHAWASVGRPLVGHASYYTQRNLLAGPLWEDGATCIDLDEHPLEEVIGQLQLFTDPDKHREMCHELRARFDALVDHDAEERAVRELLGLR